MNFNPVKTIITTKTNEHNDYAVLVHPMKDVFELLKRDGVGDDDLLLYQSIILNLESLAAESLRNNLIISIPNFANIRKNPAQQAIIKHKTALKIARKSMSKDDYVHYAKSIAASAKLEDQRKQYRKRMYASTKTKNKKKYENLYINFGKAYANFWIESLLMMEIIPYNEEIEAAFKRLKD